MGTLFTGAMIIGLLLLIAGVTGIFLTFINFTSGSPYWIQGNLTYGTFTAVGLTIIVLLTITGPEFE